jgi:hypothetical protein
MRSYTKIIQDMYRLNLRKDEHWGYTFAFTQGPYLFDYHSHSTGCSLNIDMVSPDGDKLRIYNLDTWYSPSYEFNNRDKKLGFQHEGPWIKEIGEMMRGFEAEIERENIKRVERHRIASTNWDKMVYLATEEMIEREVE